ncbi:MAG: PIN domain-containing protein [Acidobacteriia bacterium]|nr:PIN domain-containing protein [Terriglobia bacterium]
MNTVFADTFYWIALTNVQDLAHERAKAFTRSATPGTICTTEEVLIEYLNFFAQWGPHFRRKVAINIQNMQESRTVQIVPQTSASFLTGLSLYRARLDKGYSLTDCISMQTMRNEGITDVLTSDMHFDQEGFRALFRAA